MLCLRVNDIQQKYKNKYTRIIYIYHPYMYT